MKDYSDERKKWDQIYSTQISNEEEKFFQEFQQEFQKIVLELLPDGGKAIEMGSGGGWQSLALALTGKFHVTLLDFSQEALRFSKILFEKHGLIANFENKDAFETGKPEYDLVFNAGVLEHYSHEDQVKLIKAMASYSRKYVLVLVPNIHCYWYWIWRIYLTQKGDWSYGKEIPMDNLRKLFEEAGLIFAGEKILASSWTEKFIQTIEGVNDNLRDIFLQVHRSGMVPLAQTGYLLAGLGIVPGTSVTLPPDWHARYANQENGIPELITILADITANNIQIQNRYRQEASQKIFELQQQLDAISQQLSNIYRSRKWKLLVLLSKILCFILPGTNKKAE